MVCLNKTNKLTIAGGIKPIHNSYTSHHSTGWGYYKSLIPTLTKLAIPSLIILSTIISTCTPILSTTIPSVNAVTANTNQTTINNDSSSSSTSSTTNVDPSDSNYLNSVLEANGIDTSSTASNQANGSNDITTNDVDPTTMASDLASLNNALETQAANEGISLSLSSNNQPVSTTNPATINIDPSTATGSGVTANSILSATSITANVKTAMPGYSLTIQQAANTTTTSNTNIANPNGSLINPANPSNSPILSTDGTPDSPKALGNNEWGYAISGSNNFDTSYTTGNTNPLTSKWAKVPTSSETAQTIKHTTTTPNRSTGDNTVVYYGANIPKNKIAGTYQTTVTYTATANALDPPKVESVGPDSIGQGVQIVPAQIGKSSDSHASPMVMCYITDQGKVYCGGRNDTTSSGYGAAIKTLTSHYSDSSLWNDQVTDGAYNMIEAGQYTQSMGMGGRQGSYYWLEIDTSKFVGKVVQMAVIAKDGNSSNEAHGTACYLTDQGNVYCSNGSESYGTNTNMEAIDAVQYVTPSAIDWSGQARYVGQFSTIPAGTASSGHPYYWIKVNTDLLKGKITQIVAAPIGRSSDSHASPMVMCYITDQGKVYCGGRNDTTSSGYGAAIKTLTSHYSDSSLWNDQVTDGAYNMIEAGQYTQSMGMGGRQGSYYWLEIDTSKFVGKVVQMAVIAKDGNSSNEAHGTACYLTDQGNVYCSNGSESYGTNTNMEAIDAVQYVTPSAIDWSGQARYVGQFSTIPAGTASSGHPYYWIQVDTHLLEGNIKPFGNATVTITGSDLDWVTNVYVDSNNNGQLDTSTDAQCTITAQSATQITCTAPQLSPGTYNLFVVNPDNQTKVETALTYR